MLAKHNFQAYILFESSTELGRCAVIKRINKILALLIITFVVIMLFSKVYTITKSGNHQW